MRNRLKLMIFIVGAIVTSIALAQNVTFEAVLDIAVKLGVFNTSIHPKLEQAEANEAENIKNIAVDMYNIQMKLEPQSRDAHAKGHGCAEAELRIENSIPDDYQVGTFAEPGKTYQAIIRYSNGAGNTQADTVPDGHGMAVKVIGAVPNGNLLGTGTTQDFMMINGPAFFIGSVSDYALFQDTIVTDGKPDRFILGRGIREAITESHVADGEKVSQASIEKIEAAIAKLPDPFPLEGTLNSLFATPQAAWLEAALYVKLGEMALKKAPLELRNIAVIQRNIGSCLTESYYSMSSYLLKAKSGDTAVKYSVHPINCQTGQELAPAALPPKNASSSYLSEDLAHRLRTAPACFELYLQPLPSNLSDDARKSLVEDTRQNFGTTEIQVARLTLPVQSVDIPAKEAYCENLSYNPWQTSEIHQPLGSMNRARKLAVTASSIRRHLFNGTQRLEPVSLEEYRSLK